VRVLIVGGGGREHALAWALRRDDPDLELIAAPGNPGLAAIGRCEAVPVTDLEALATLAARERVDFTVVGPEGPLSKGIVDHFRAKGLAVFGPTQAAARIESSKRFAKELMLKANVPTGLATTFTTIAAAKEEVRRLGAPVVVKASGIAAGKALLKATMLASSASSGLSFGIITADTRQ
jgi:phosphoribosylamine--glycine ligase